MAALISQSISHISYVLTALPETSQGVGFTADTVTLAADLVEDDIFLLDCYVIKFKCTPAKVEIVGTVGGQSRKYNKDGVGEDLLYSVYVFLPLFFFFITFAPSQIVCVELNFD